MPAQETERQNIRHNHETVDQVGAFPDEVHRDYGAEIDHDNINQFIIRDTFISDKVFRCLFPKIRPADQGCDGKGHQGDR